VIAQPQILALDNQEVVIADGQQVPFLSGFTSSLGAVGGGGQTGGFGLNPIQNIDRQQIGTTLTITPQINDGGTMTLDIALESSELAGITGDAGSQITNNRELNTKVRVENGQTIVLGGMVRNSASRTETRVPFLGKLPIIGHLFKTRGGENRQRMLMVFIRPVIVNDSTQMGNATRTKYNLIRDEQIRQGNQREVLPLLPNTPQPQLPEFDDVPNPIQPAPPAGAGATTTPVP
jgi:general secretion pathway protein D